MLQLAENRIKAPTSSSKVHMGKTLDHITSLFAMYIIHVTMLHEHNRHKQYLNLWVHCKSPLFNCSIRTAEGNSYDL